MQIGISLVERTRLLPNGRRVGGGTYEWSVSPFYGRLLRRNWDVDGNLLVQAGPPAGYPDGHLQSVLVGEDGETPVRLEGSAIGAVVEVIVDHEEGTLSFKLNGGPEGPRIRGFPVGDVGGMLLRPVIGFRWAEDVVTVRSGAARLRDGWPQQLDNAARERDARGLAAARALATGESGGTAGGGAGAAAGGLGARPPSPRMHQMQRLVRSGGGLAAMLHARGGASV